MDKVMLFLIKNISSTASLTIKVFSFPVPWNNFLVSTFIVRLTIKDLRARFKTYKAHEILLFRPLLGLNIVTERDRVAATSSLSLQKKMFAFKAQLGRPSF